MLEPVVSVAHRHKNLQRNNSGFFFAWAPVTGSEFKNCYNVNKSREDWNSHTSETSNRNHSAARRRSLCSSIWFSNVVFPLCDGLSCIVSYFLFAGSYASWQDLFLSILHFKWSLIMFNHSIFLPCDVDLPDSYYLCYYVQIFLFASEILFYACWFILSLQHPSIHSQWIWALLHGVKVLINIQCILKNVMILLVPWSLRLSILEAVWRSFSGQRCRNSVIIPSGLFKYHAKL